MLAGLASVATVPLAGCSLLGGPLTFEASPATVTEAAQTDTGDTHYQTTRPTVSRTFSNGGVRTDVEVTNVVAQYDRALDLSIVGLGRSQTAVFAVLSTPQVKVAGQTFNPVGEMSSTDIAARFQARYEDLDGLSEDGTYDATVAGVATTVTRYAGRSTLVEGEVALNVFIHVADPVAAGEDFVVPLATHPRAFDEGASIRRLLAGVEHG